MKKELRLKLFFLIFWIFLIISFSALAVFVVAEATGLRFNRMTYHLEATGLIYLDGTPKNSTIVINDKIISNSFPLRLGKIFPGQYEIFVSKENYTTWSKNVSLHAHQAIELDEVQLFLLNPTSKITDRRISSENLSSDFINQGSKLKLINNEIWYEDKLITRFSTQIFSAILDSTKRHIFFQNESSLQVMDLDGSNVIKLFDFPKNEKYIYALYNDRILYLNNDQIMEVKIR